MEELGTNPEKELTLPLGLIWVCCIFLSLSYSGPRRLKMIRLVHNVLLIHQLIPLERMERAENEEGNVEKLDLALLAPLYHLSLGSRTWSMRCWHCSNISSGVARGGGGSGGSG